MKRERERERGRENEGQQERRREQERTSEESDPSLFNEGREKYRCPEGATYPCRAFMVHPRTMNGP